MPATSPPATGQQVRIRDEHWTVERAGTEGPCTILDVQGHDADNRHLHTSFVLPFEACELVPTSPRAKRITHRGWRRLARRMLADCTPSPATLLCAARSAFDPLPFQLEPALACVRGDTSRLLIADAVGLGKTIQAGLIVAEALERRRGARSLIVVPGGLREQWQRELRERFGLDPVILDATGLWRLTASLPPDVNPWTVPRTVITSIDFVKRPEVVRSLEPLVWDVVVFDEAHSLCGFSDRATAAAGLATRGRIVVLLTATPHSGDEQTFERLCGIGDIAGQFPLTIFRRTRAQLGFETPRRIRWLSIEPTNNESLVQQQLLAYTRQVWQHNTSPGARLAMLVLLKRGASSLTALARSLARRRQALSTPDLVCTHQLTLPLDGEDEGTDDVLAAIGLEDRALEISLLDDLLASVGSTGETPSKVFTLTRLLRRTAEPVIVFTQYRDTLEDIAVALNDVSVARLHGGLSAAERQEAERRFTSGEARVLLATDAGSEGLNLHARCRLVVSLDPPWTSVRLEQRIGRVDRIGQRRQVRAWHLIVRGSYEEFVASRVREREALAQAALTEPGPEDELAAAAAVVLADGAHAWPGTPPTATRMLSHTVGPEAIEEAGRIRTWRALLRHACTHLPRRPFVTHIRRQPRQVLLAFRATFGDETSEHVWHTMVGLVADPSPLSGSLEPWLDSPVVHQHITAVLARRRDALMAPLVRRAAQDVRRTRAIEHVLVRSRSRLAATLVQPNLFSGRLEREAAPQLAMLDESLRAIEHLVSEAQGQARLELKAVVPAFAVGLR